MLPVGSSPWVRRASLRLTHTARTRLWPPEPAPAGEGDQIPDARLQDQPEGICRPENQAVVGPDVTHGDTPFGEDGAGHGRQVRRGDRHPVPPRGVDMDPRAEPFGEGPPIRWKG